VRKTIEGDGSLIDPYEKLLGEVELYITRTAKRHDGQTFTRVHSVPGIGQILALVIRYAMQDIQRFPRVPDCVSYCRLVKCAKEAKGTRLGTAGKKIGTGHLCWAFAEAALLCLRQTQLGKAYFTTLARKQGKAQALTGLAHKRARAGYDLLTREHAVALQRFVTA
jgi:transposase